MKRVPQPMETNLVSLSSVLSTQFGQLLLSQELALVKLAW